MTSLNTRQHRRDQDTDWIQRSWYTLQIVNRNNVSVSSGSRGDNGGALGVTPFGTLSSENWQLFPQGGRYFIRNWDYGPQYQLGLTTDNAEVPHMYQRSGSVTQQWSVTRVEGGWELTNGLLGNTSKLSLSMNDDAPVMRNDDQRNAIWNITRNESADPTGPKNGMYDLVDGFEVAQPLVSSRTSNALSTVTQSFVPIASQQTQSDPSSLSTGKIVGIAIGSIAIGTILFTMIWLYMAHRRRRETQHSRQHDPVDASSYHSIEKHDEIQELPVSPTELDGTERTTHIAELASSPAACSRS